jgi:hypothetical protein
MTGGLMQLVAYGAQDIYLTGNPIITYFKTVYRRHTNFAMEAIEQTFNNVPDFGKKVKTLISRNGDLVSGIYLEVTLPHIKASAGKARWTDSVGHYLIDNVEIRIGGQMIDRHYGDWLEIWAQLTVPASKAAAYYELIGLDGKVGLQNRPSDNGEYAGIGANRNSSGNRILYVPLQFWFCRNVGLALPLIALQYHEVEIYLSLNTLDNLAFEAGAISTSVTVGTETVVLGDDQVLNVKLWVDYIYLDSEERRRFAQVSHEYLIEQLQFQGDMPYSSATIRADLDLNHPVKELIWVCRQTVATNAKQWVNYTSNLADFSENDQAYMGRPSGNLDAVIYNGTSLASIAAYHRIVSGNMVQKATIRLNGFNRMAEREGVYFNRVVPLAHHTSIPASPGINVYSFALQPEEHQPSGTCNFSRIDNAKLYLTLSGFTADHQGNAVDVAGVLKIFAVNYNVLRIMSGMGGVAYAN